MPAISSTKTALLLIVMLSAMAALAACEGGAKEFDLEVRRGALTLSPAVIRVEQFKDIVLNMTTDEVGTLRIAGYDIATTLEPGKTVPIKFVATRVGNFAITWQGQTEQTEAKIAAFDVRPVQ